MVYTHTCKQAEHSYIQNKNNFEKIKSIISLYIVTAHSIREYLLCRVWVVGINVLALRNLGSFYPWGRHY